MNLFLKSLIYILFLIPLTSFGAEPIPEKPLVVVIPSYNNIQWYEKNLSSVFMQKYSNYRVVYVDDGSPDGTADAVEEYVTQMGKWDQFLIIRNSKRLGSPLANHYNAIVNHCYDEEIVLCLDGDDWFSHDGVFSTINKAYSTEKIWATHGTLREYPNGSTAWSIPVPSETIKKNAFRTYRCPSHLKTFYAWLFKKINIEDLQYKGEFFKATGDQAMMFPIVEMAGYRHKFISEVLYIYNMSNPLGESIVSTQLQRDMEAVVRARKPYLPLEDGYDDAF